MRTLLSRAIVVALPAYMVLVALATHWPHVEIPGSFQWRDKVVHFGAFGVLALLVWVFVRTRRGRLASVSAWWLLGVLAIYAGLDEYTQQFFGRDTDVLDWCADTGGVACVLAVCEALRARSRRP